MRRTWAAAVALATLLVAAVPGCNSRSAGSTLVVLAASSLTEAFTKMGAEFETSHPGTKVDFSFGASDALAQQIDQGTPADVFSPASSKWMDDVEANGPGVSHRVDFARNRLVVIVPKDNPAAYITSRIWDETT